MSSSDNFKNLSIELIIESNKNKLRDDSPIKNLNDLIYTLHYLTFWSVDFLPKIIYDYIDLNLFEIYEYIEDYISNNFIDKIKIYVESKFNIKKNFSYGYTFLVKIRKIKN